MTNNSGNDIIEVSADLCGYNLVSDIWLRVYPLPKQPYENFYSIVFRCIFCILGLYSVIILWTIIFVFIIHSIEGPHEVQVSTDFEENQNQLVIDLATELRQITPLSPKWKEAIIRRIDDERQLTMLAVNKGAKLHSGQYWNLSGTFLFTIYVMTTLGFGAPVPQTLWGRTAALIYALLAVPVHLYLMLNISTSIINRLENVANNLKDIILKTKSRFSRKPTQEIKSNLPNCSKDSTIIQTKNRSYVKNRIASLLNILSTCRCILVITVCYYVCGALAFGWSRNKQPLEIVMFPLEFTTSGGLELVKGHVRFLYGLYVEGAVILIACLLYAVKRSINRTMNGMVEKYRLFTSISVK